ncbi:MAG: UvrD-helicase domain-containing protein, partial [Candidatus Omnitrophica bacterium]|nr:UvrD-helicase domain-containing protein [Candidatus Omnitrophota bacterium]
MKKYIIKTDNIKSISPRIDFEKDLNPEQYKVVTQFEGPSLVLAGAGSGKTRTLVYRVAYLLSKGIPPQNILLVTFTNKAARTMQDRIEMLLKAKPKNLWSGTFHHIGNRSLRLYAKALSYKSDFGILDEGDAMDLIKVCIKNLNLKIAEQRFPRPKVIRTVISYSINSGKAIEQTLEDFYPYFLQFQEVLKRIKNEYEYKKKISNVMDYDDLLTKWLWLLQNVPDAKERFTQQFRYILVDEYQDTNRLQAGIIRELSEFHRNVLVVGDDAQAIYSFRGADVSNILNFPKDYPDAKIFKLETNYRSIPEILDLANDSISHNMNQFEKHLRTIKESLDKPALIEVRDLYA